MCLGIQLGNRFLCYASPLQDNEHLKKNVDIFTISFFWRQHSNKNKSLDKTCSSKVCK